MAVCSECKWYVPHKLFGDGEYAKCFHPKNVIADVSLTYKNTRDYSAERTRMHGRVWSMLFDKCGRDGRWWEPRQ